MSRVAKNPVTLPAGVEVKLTGQQLSVKGAKGTLELNVHSSVEVLQEAGELRFAARNGDQQTRAMAGTTRALVNNMVIGVSTGFERKMLAQAGGFLTFEFLRQGLNDRTFQSTADGKYLVQIFLARAGYKSSPIVVRLHNQFLIQTHQHFSNPGPTGGEHLRQFFLTQLGARQQAALTDGRINAVVDVLDAEGFGCSHSVISRLTNPISLRDTGA